MLGLQNIGNYCNCTQPAKCPSPGADYECCKQKVPKGKNATFGLWVTNGCDQTLGLPVGASKQNSAVDVENFDAILHGNIEGYNHRRLREEETNTCTSVCMCRFLLIILILGIICYMINNVV